MNAKTDVSDLNVWNMYKFQADKEWIKGDFTGNGKTDVSDLNIWMKYRFTEADMMGPGGDGGDTLLDEAAIVVTYDPETGVMTCDTSAADLTSLIIVGPQPVSVDRWLNDTYQDTVYWSQQYFDSKEQWGGLNQHAVPRAVYQVATYATGLTAQDFGQVEFATLDRQILFATVQIVGGLRMEAPLVGYSASTFGETDNGAPLLGCSQSTLPAPEASTAPALGSWLYEYEPPRNTRPFSQPADLSPSAVDLLMASS